MKILHTSDWHLGAKTDRRNRIDEQRKVMNEIVSTAQDNDVDVVIIAGDIFDQAIPTSDAEELFYNTLEKLSEDNNRVIIALAGNHDDPKRLSANRHFAKKHNIVLVGDLNPICEINTESKNRVVEVGEGYVIVESNASNKGKERLAVAILPYPMEYRLNCKVEGETYEEKVKAWARIACKGFKRDTFNILATHLMVAGGTLIENDFVRTFKVGDVNIVSKSDFPKADYYALGHIHDYQVIKDNMVYCSAPIKLAYSQKNSGMVLIKTNKDKLEDFKFVPTKSACKMDQVCVMGKENLAEALKNYNDNDIVELTIVQNSPLTSKDIKEIKENYPCVLQVKLQLTNLEKDDKVYIGGRDKLSNKELFENFYRSKKNIEPSKEIVKLFLDLMEDKSGETN